MAKRSKRKRRGKAPQQDVGASEIEIAQLHASLDSRNLLPQAGVLARHQPNPPVIVGTRTDSGLIVTPQGKPIE